MNTLVRGANAELPAHLLLPGASLRCLARWRHVEGSELDLCAVLLGADGQARSDRDLIFFNNTGDPSGAVRSLGRVTQGTDEFDCVEVRLAHVPADVNTILFAGFGPFERLSDLPGFELSLADSRSGGVAQFDLTGVGDEAAIMLAELYRRGDGWKVRCLGQGWTSGMEGLLNHVGIETQDEGEVAHSESTSNHGGSRRAPDDPWSIPPSTSQSCPNPAPSPAPLAATPPPSTRSPASTPAPTVSPTAPPAQAAQVTRSRSMFGPRKSDLVREIDELHAEISRLAGIDPSVVRRQVAVAEEELRNVQAEIVSARRELTQIRHQIVEADDLVSTQAAGVYEFEHPLDTSVQYKARLDTLRARYKASVKAGTAVTAATNWTVNGSLTQGASMVRDMSKLLLRAFNAEADHCARTVRARTLDSNVKRLEKAADSIARLGKSMSIKVNPAYVRMRTDELRLVADYYARVELEKEQEREERARLRDEQRAQAEFERETNKLEVERQKNEEALRRAVNGTADQGVIAQLEARILELDESIVAVERRAANLRMGTVYVISNVGAFGPNMVKIGMTRRINPDDRVRELGDASVPFRFDTHALIFSEDAVALEGRLHAAFADQRVNMINARREFFYVSPAQVREVLATYQNEHLVEFSVEADAEEWRRSGARDDGWNGVGAQGEGRGAPR